MRIRSIHLPLNGVPYARVSCKCGMLDQVDAGRLHHECSDSNCKETADFRTAIVAFGAAVIPVPVPPMPAAKTKPKRAKRKPPTSAAVADDDSTRYDTA